MPRRSAAVAVARPCVPTPDVLVGPQVPWFLCTQASRRAGSPATRGPGAFVIGCGPREVVGGSGLLSAQRARPAANEGVTPPTLPLVATPFSGKGGFDGLLEQGKAVPGLRRQPALRRRRRGRGALLP